MSTLEGLSKKEKLRRENDALLHEAKKSSVDRATGRVRCLSCGNLFGSPTALAAHLRKHDGVNSLDYRPRRVVGTSHAFFGGRPVERPPEVKLGEFLSTGRNNQVNTPKATDAPSHQKVLKPNVHTPDHLETKNGKGKKRNKMSPLKRSILIQQVLSLTQKLDALRMELSTLTARPTDQRLAVEPAQMRKQVKRVQGCINSTKSELQMALNVINQKLSFRQLVMLEFLTNRMELSMATSGNFEECMAAEEPGGSLDAIQKTEEESLNGSEAVLYDEAGSLQEIMEAAYEAEWMARMESDASRLIETRRDAESGKVYIKKPLLVESIVTPSSTERSDLINDEAAGTFQGDDDADEKIEIRELQRHDGDGKEANNVDDSSLSSHETFSMDDDMRGFGDVLMEWVKKTEHNTKSISRDQTHQFFQDDDTRDCLEENGEEDVLNEAEKLESPDETKRTEVQVVRVRKGLNADCSQESNDRVYGMEKEEWSHGAVEDRDEGSHCIFIKPLLGVPVNVDVQRGSSPGKKKKCEMPGKTLCQEFPRQQQKQQSCICDQRCTTRSKFGTVSESAPGPKKDCSLDEAVHTLLTKLCARQHEHMKNNDGKSSQRWMVSGFAEVKKHLVRGSVKLIVVAKNLNDSINAKVSEIQGTAQEHGVPVIFALTRKKIGQIYHVRKKMSVIALFDHQDFDDLFSAVIQHY